MKHREMLLIVAAAMLLSFATGCAKHENPSVSAVRELFERYVGERSSGIDIEICTSGNDNDYYEIEASDGHLSLTGSSPTAICYAFDRYLRYACNSMITWSGSHMELPVVWPDYHERSQSPYQFRYFLNVCTFGYTTPYWDWQRWSQEIDWMALHGVNMPLASVASEAIARRVWLKMGLDEQETDTFFTGAAHLPWHRMGNLNSFDGPLPKNWHDNQIALQHKILDRMRALGMEPVAPAFAGFVPPAFIDKHPEIKYNRLYWGGFDAAYNACVLSPDSPYFNKIGAMFVKEWENEFGQAKYFLSDSFNEMRLPVDENDTESKYEILAAYGEAVYKSITAGDADAVWVTQGWTFGYQHDFWDKASMQALLSRVPDDKMIIVDLGNDYPKWIWHTNQTWRVQEGFYGKRWIFSYVPNFGGKVLPTGDIAMYASMSTEALRSPYATTLAGFGSAPEGLENNEVVYELLSDMGWSSTEIDLDKWMKQYCVARYGCYDDCMQKAWDLFRSTVYASLYSYPRFTWQTVVPDMRRISRHAINDDYGLGVRSFLACADKCSKSQLYVNDAVEFTSIWLGELADRHYGKALAALEVDKTAEAEKELKKTVSILEKVDQLLASHPDYNLSRWIDFARASASSEAQKNAAEANAKRLITTWGGFQEDYAARLWSGLIADYYIPRLEIYFSSGRSSLDSWEENWIKTPSHITASPMADPIGEAVKLIETIK